MKDLPAHLPTGLTIAAVLPREDPRDAFMSPIAKIPGRAQNGRDCRLLVGAPHRAGVKTAA